VLGWLALFTECPHVGTIASWAVKEAAP
jgi:hypothetical protein